MAQVIAALPQLAAINQLETDIIVRLSEVLSVSELRIMAWPDKPLETGRPVGKAALMVRFNRLNLDPVNRRTTGPIVQSGELDIEIRYLVKGLRSHTGAYSLIEQTTAALTGFLPESAALLPGMAPQLPGFYSLTTQLIDHDQGANLWDWGQLFRLNIDYRGKINDRRR